MARVLSGEYDSIRLEPPGLEGQGVEFWLQSAAGREYHQVKRQRAGSGRWTLKALAGTGVLKSFYDHLTTDANAKCVFVSMQDAPEIRELAERARSAADLSEFEREFVKGGWDSHFAELRGYWSNCDATETFSCLKRIDVRTIDEVTLCRLGELELTPHVEGETGATGDVLFAVALESVHQELDGTRIADHLHRRGFRRPIWSQPKQLSDVIRTANDRYLSRLRREFIQDKLLARKEADTVIKALESGSGKRGVIITGVAGSGKSAVMFGVVEHLRQHNIPLLAFRVDNLTPTQSPKEAGRQIDLHESPVTTLAALAQGRPSVLVIDQLDAVSLTSGRNPEFFECFDEMVRQALLVSGMRVVIACRKFDYENDSRLRQLGGRNGLFDRVEIGVLSDDIVHKTVKELGIEPSRLTAKQTRLLSTPAHLKLLCETAQGSGTSLDFDTANGLYELYWQKKDQLLRGRLGSTIEWTPVIDRLCEHMNEKQTLSAPITLLDDDSAVRDALLSEHVLVQDGTRVSFFHESFFDYAFARRFAATDGNLIGLLRAGEQLLFRRAQVRQILLREREIDQSHYLKNLETLLASSDIRFHIKQVVFALLAQLPDPCEEEWRILDRLMRNPDYPHRQEVWHAITGPHWFRLLDSLGVLAAWLAQDDLDTINNAVWLLLVVQRECADRVAELIEPYLDVSKEWRDRIRSLFLRADVDAGRRFFDLFLKLIDNGALDGVGRFHTDDFLGFLYDMLRKHPDWACEAIGRFLLRHLTLTEVAGETNPFEHGDALRRSQSAEKVLVESAQAAPAGFVKHVLPFVLRVIELNADRLGKIPWRDRVWRWRHRDGGHRFEDYLLHATEEALRRLASDFPDEFIRVVAPLRASECETVQFLIIRAHAANGQRFADEAIDYLCESPERFSHGYSNDAHEAARDLITSITPHCSSERLAVLENAILDYYPVWERTADRLQWRGESQFELLLAIEEKRRSPRAQARIGEWQRKFQRAAPPPPLTGGAHWVGPPISAEAGEKMSDEQWLSAVAHYASDGKHEWRDGKPVGGPHELSQMLEAQVRECPLRFARLVLRFPDETNSAYFHAVLRGLDGGSANAGAIFDACRRCHRLPNRPVGSAFCWLVEKQPDLPWPDDLLDAIAWYATEDPDPDHESWRTQASSGQCHYGGNIYTAGINCVRGVAAGAIRSLLFADGTRLSRFLPTLLRMVRDPSIAVRSCVVTALLALLNHDRNLAVELFLELCDAEDVLLKTDYVEEFMRYTTSGYFQLLRPIVERMLRSEDVEVVQAGARRACVASLDQEIAAELAAQCISGSEAMRKGAAQVFAANVGQDHYRGVCQVRLIALFEDPHEEVRALAAECFDKLEDDGIRQVTPLVGRFLASAAFPANYDHLIRALERTTARLPKVTILVCNRFIEIAGRDAGDLQTWSGFYAHSLSELIMRAYHQADDPAVRKRCLDTIDQLLQARTWGMLGALDQVDR